jgi:hypothetical protein
MVRHNIRRREFVLAKEVSKKRKLHALENAQRDFKYSSY